MKPHSDCFNIKLNHTPDQEELLGEIPVKDTKTFQRIKQILGHKKMYNFS